MEKIDLLRERVMTLMNRMQLLRQECAQLRDQVRLLEQDNIKYKEEFSKANDTLLELERLRSEHEAFRKEREVIRNWVDEMLERISQSGLE